MIKEFIGTGKTVADATAAAKTGLNAPALADINIEVVVMPSKGFLGIGKKDAQVKAWYDDGKKEKKPQHKKEAPAKRAEKKAEPKKPQPNKEKAVKKEEPKKEKPVKKEEPKKEKPVKKEEPVKVAPAPKAEEMPAAEDEVKITAADIDMQLPVAYIKTILKGFNIDDAEVTAAVEDGVLKIEINCDDYGIIIGRRGETLDSLQYLTSLAVKKSCDKYVRVTIDVGNYREKRMETLKNLARKNANYVLRTGRRYTFEPMNPYERRIIHTAVQEIEGVESLSIGYGQDRKVVIQSLNRGRRDNNKSSAPARNTARKPERADFTKFGKIEINKD